MSQRCFRFLRAIGFFLIYIVCTLNSSKGQVLFTHNDSAKSDFDSTVWLKYYKLSARDTVGFFPNNELYLSKGGAFSKVDMRSLGTVPYSDINQMLDGRATGIRVMIPTAEQGKRNGALIRGYSNLLLNNGDVMTAQPTYLLNGVPILLDHPFAFDIQRFDNNRLGTENNLLSLIDQQDIKSITVLKDFEASARYGPLAAAGVVNIETYGPRSGALQVDVNAHMSYSRAPDIQTAGGAYVRDFLNPFYQKYAGIQQLQNFPAYLADSARSEYYGPSNWDDLYFKDSWSDGVQAAISGGSRLANFRFSVGQTSYQGVRDATGFNRYTVNFGINIMPLHNLLITTYLSGATMGRKRNRFIRDRIVDEDYVLNLEAPPSPNSNYLSNYYFNLNQSIDNNRNNSINVLANVQYSFSNSIKVNSRMGINYTQNFRDLFIPSTVNDGNNFSSNFDGFNKAIVWDNSVNFDKIYKNRHHLTAALGMYTEWDKWDYKYGKAYKGKSDYIKIYQPGDDDNHESTSNNFRLTANAIDRIQSNLASLYGNFKYSYDSKYEMGVYLRRDGSSNIPAANRWLLSPTVSAAWVVSNENWLKSDALSLLKLRASMGRVGKLLAYDYYKAGPIYDVEIGWNGNPNLSTYNAFPVLNGSYELGYVSRDIEWPYVDQLNIGADIGFLEDRLSISLDFYNKSFKNLLLKMPVMEEKGYTGVVKNGLQIDNKGVEVTIDAKIIDRRHFAWQSTFGASSNKNKLGALPNHYPEIIIGDRYFKVGQPVDAYWLLQNKGIYAEESEIPVDPETHQKLSYQGLPIHAGDPKWVDMNGDYVIDDHDRALKGSPSPDIFGFFSNRLRYKKISLEFLFKYSFGAELMDEAQASAFDFANRDGSDNLEGVKEINFWQVHKGNYDEIPLYNPWSTVNPYQVNQDLFLKDASFIKLKTVTLTYQFSPKALQKLAIKNLDVYVSAQNLWMWSPYKGGDPEAVSYFGYANGYYNWSYPKTFTLGFNLKF